MVKIFETTDVFDISLCSGKDSMRATCVADIDMETEDTPMPDEDRPLKIKTSIYYAAGDGDNRQEEQIEILHEVGLKNPIILAVVAAPVAKSYGLCVGRHCITAMTAACYDVYRVNSDELKQLTGASKYRHFIARLVEKKSGLGGEALRAMGSCAVETTLPHMGEIWQAIKQAL